MAFTGKVKQIVAENLLSHAMMVLSHSPEGSYRLLAKGFDRIAITEQQKMIASWLCNWVAPGNPGAPWFSRVLRQLHPNVRRNYIARTIVDIFFRNPESFAQYKAEHGFRPPPIMLISPTMRCNYRCAGCYAGNYGSEDDMPPALFDRVLCEAKELTTKFFIILGGEPLVYRPLLDIFEKHRDAPFQVYTNGSLIDETMARRLAELGNVAPQVSIDGFREETDARRGRGTFDRALKAMDHLREAGCIFAFSSVVTKDNVDAVTSEEFIDLMIEKGCLYGWYFLYMPVGRDPDLNNMPTPEQRNQLRLAGKRFRETKPILLADFWNDAPLTGGCISGGRTYCHINHKGDVEPCIFVHFATDNIKEVSLAQALNSPFFKGLRKMEPFCYNTLRPCPVIDHPWLIRTAIEKYGARPTHEGAESLLSAEIATGLDCYAQKVKELYDPIWDREYADWAEKWFAAMDYPEGRVEARKAGYCLSRAKEEVSNPATK